EATATSLSSSRRVRRLLPHEYPAPEQTRRQHKPHKLEQSEKIGACRRLENNWTHSVRLAISRQLEIRIGQKRDRLHSMQAGQLPECRKATSRVWSEERRRNSGATTPCLWRYRESRPIPKRVPRLRWVLSWRTPCALPIHSTVRSSITQ